MIDGQNIMSCRVSGGIRMPHTFSAHTPTKTLPWRWKLLVCVSGNKVSAHENWVQLFHCCWRSVLDDCWSNYTMKENNIRPHPPLSFMSDASVTHRPLWSWLCSPTPSIYPTHNTQILPKLPLLFMFVFSSYIYHYVICIICCHNNKDAFALSKLISSSWLVMLIPTANVTGHSRCTWAVSSFVHLLSFQLAVSGEL